MKKKMKKLKKQIKGITLIALVITIIVLLILAAVAINLTIGSNGIFTRTKDAVDRYEIAAIEEKNQNGRSSRNYRFIYTRRNARY